MRRKLPHALAEWLLVTAAILAIAALSATGNWLWRMDLQLHDVASSESAPAADPEVVIVAIDDASLAAIGRWPWSRDIHARLIDRLREAGAAGVALDVILAEPAPGDAALAQAMRRYGRVVLPVLQKEANQRIVGEIVPVPELASVARLGHIQVEFDPDGLARSVYLWEGWHAPRHPQLGLALLMAGGVLAPPAEAVEPLQQTPDEVWVRRQWLRIPFAGPPGSFRQLSYVDVLEGRADPALLRGHLVLVGATALGLADSVPVPTSGFSRPMAGVEVHANVLNALRHGGGVTQLPPWANAAIAAAILLCLMIGLGRSSPRFGLFLTFGLILAICLGAWVALLHARMWFPPSSTLAGCLLAYPLWSWRRLEATQRYLDQELDALRHEAQIEMIASPDPLQRRLITVRRATARSREIKHLVEDTIEHLPVGVIALHPDGRVRLHNAAARRLLGAPDADSLGARLRQLRWPADLPLDQGVPVPPPTPLRIEGNTPLGTPVQITLSSLQAKPAGLVVGVVDLTEVRAAQQAREDTLRYVSHDLRAPLASIISLLDSPIAEQATLPQLRKLARSALDLVDELFRLGRAEAADPAHFVTLDLIQLMHEAADECWTQARAGATRIEVDQGGVDEALARGNGELLRRALVNLLGNAIKYGGDCGPVQLALRRAGTAWEIAVRDRGPGIPEEERNRLFERFSRLPSAIRRGLPGIGLGLAMARTVAERHGGAIRAEFPRDGGSRFVLGVPAVGNED